MSLIDVYDDAVRGLVSSTLGGIGEPAVEPLLRVMKQDKPGFEQGPAAFRRSKLAAEAAFKAMGEPALEPVINHLLNDEDPEVRGVAADILGTVWGWTRRSAVAVPPLIRKLTRDWRGRSDAGRRRRSACWAIPLCTPVRWRAHHRLGDPRRGGRRRLRPWRTW